MTVKGVFALLSAAVLTALAAFHCGAHVGRSSHHPSREQTVEKPAAVAVPTSSVEELRLKKDYTRVTIENVDRLNFEQTYELLRSSPREALAHWAKRLDELPASPRKSAAISAFYKTLAQTDARAAVDLTLRMTRRDARSDAAAAIQATVTPIDLPEFGRLLVGLNVRRGGFASLLSDWSEHDPVSASRFAEAHASQVDSYSITGLVSNWVQIDAAAARAWLDHVAPDKKSPALYESFYGAWLESDRSAATSDLVSRAGGKKLHAAITQTAARLLGDSEAEARAFFSSLPDPASQRAALDGMTTRFIGRSIYSDALRVDPTKYANWLLELPPQLAGEQIGQVVSAWSADQPEAAHSWLNQMPTHTRDSVLSQVCRALDWNDAQRNFQAGFNIRDGRVREESLRAALRRAGSQENARELITRLQLPAAEIAQLQQIADEL